MNRYAYIKKSVKNGIVGVGGRNKNKELYQSRGGYHYEEVNPSDLLIHYRLASAFCNREGEWLGIRIGTPIGRDDATPSHC